MDRSERIYLSPPDVSDADRNALVAAFDSGWVAPAGPDIDRFEHELAVHCNRSHAVALSSGSAAIHLGLLVLGVGPEHEVIVPTLTFAATANPVAYLGARPVFVDVDPSDWTISLALLEAAVRGRRARGAMVKAVVPVDLYGQCARYPELLRFAAEHELAVFADAAESLGASRDGIRAGASGVAAALSFNGNKIITTSGGGALVTDDDAIASRVKYLSTQARQPVAHYEHTDVGYNYRLSNLLAALGRSQLSDLPRRIERRNQIGERYAERLRDVDGLTMMPVPSASSPNWWLTCVQLPAGCDPEAVRVALERDNIETRRMWKPLHLQPVFAEAVRFLDGTAEAIWDRGLCLPSGSAMTNDQVDFVAATLIGAMRRAA